MDNIGHLAEAIQNTLIGDRYESNRKDKKFYLSDSCGCQRTRWLKRKGIEQTFDPHVMWTLKIGELYHEFAYNSWRTQGLLVETEETLENEHFKGRLDSRVWLPGKVKQAIADVKSAGEYPMKKVVENNEVDEGYIAQVLSYVYFNQVINKSDIDTGILVFMNKAPGDKAPYIAMQKEFTLDNMFRRRLEDDMNGLVEHWVNDTVPPCTCAGWKKRYAGKYNNFYPLCSASEADVKQVVQYLEDPNYSIFALGDRVEIRKSDGSVVRTMLK